MNIRRCFSGAVATVLLIGSLYGIYFELFEALRARVGLVYGFGFFAVVFTFWLLDELGLLSR